MRKDLYLSRLNIIILTLIAIISITVTTILIVNKRSLLSSDSKPSLFEVSDVRDITNEGTEFGLTSLEDTYNNNDLHVTEESYTPNDENIFKADDDNFDYKQNSKYFQISGLKNQSIQDKINKEIKKYTADTTFYTKSTINANFSNVLSITISKLVDINKYDNINLNYDLTTGKQIPFKNLFVKGANLNYIMSSSIYDSLIENLSKKGITDVKEFSYLHEMSADYVNRFNDGENVYYYFNSNNIYFTMKSNDKIKDLLDQDNIYFKIDMKDYYEQIAIFNRYITEKTIFDDSYASDSKNLIVFN